MNSALVAGRDYYVENGRYVFTAWYLLRRGHCCDSGCRHCPYDDDGRPRPEARTEVAARWGSDPFPESEPDARR